MFESGSIQKWEKKSESDSIQDNLKAFMGKRRGRSEIN